MTAPALARSKIRNLTPHVAAVYYQDEPEKVGSPKGSHYIKAGAPRLVREFPPDPDGLVARVEETRRFDRWAGPYVAVYEVLRKGVVNLPPQAPNTYLIVSLMVRQACPDREDLLSPGAAIRDEKGAIVGCLGFDGNRQAAGGKLYAPPDDACGME